MSPNMNLDTLQKRVKDNGAWRAAVQGVKRVGRDLMIELQQDMCYQRTQWQGVPQTNIMLVNEIQY